MLENEPLPLKQSLRCGGFLPKGTNIFLGSINFSFISYDYNSTTALITFDSGFVHSANFFTTCPKSAR
jgi:hypothetical protein